jgi:hypothetical protein
MNKYFIGIALLFVAMAGYAGVTSDQKFKLNQHGGSAAHGTRLGTLVDQPGSLSVVWNASTGSLGSSTLRSGTRAARNTNNGPAGVHNLGAQIPKQSLITHAWVEVTEPPVTLSTAVGDSYGAAPGISFHCSTKATGKTTVSLSSSTLYSNAAMDGNPNSLSELTAADTLATFQRNDSTADCEVQAQIHGAAHTSGKITLFIRYMQIR